MIQANTFPPFPCSPTGNGGSCLPNGIQTPGFRTILLAIPFLSTSSWNNNPSLRPMRSPSSPTRGNSHTSNLIAKATGSQIICARSARLLVRSWVCLSIGHPKPSLPSSELSRPAAHSCSSISVFQRSVWHSCSKTPSPQRSSPKSGLQKNGRASPLRVLCLCAHIFRQTPAPMLSTLLARRACLKPYVSRTSPSAIICFGGGRTYLSLPRTECSTSTRLVSMFRSLKFLHHLFQERQS